MTKLSSTHVPFPDLVGGVKPLLDIVSQAVSTRGFHSIHIEVGRPVTIRAALEPDDQLDGLGGGPRSLLRQMDIIPFAVSPAPGGVQFLQAAQYLATQGLMPVYGSVGSVPDFMAYVGMPEVPPTVSTFYEEYDAKFMGLPIYEDTTVDRDVVILVGGVSESINRANLRYALLWNIEEKTNVRTPNTRGWHFL